MAVPYTAVSGSAPLAAAVALWMIGGGVAAAVLVELINCNDEEGVVSSFAIFAHMMCMLFDRRHVRSAPPSPPVGVGR